MIRKEVLAALEAEHRRLGEPLRANFVPIQDVVAHVNNLLSNTNQEDDEGEEDGGGDEAEAVEDENVWYSVTTEAPDQESDWVLQAHNMAGDVLASAALPPLEEVGEDCNTFWQIIVQDGISYAWAGGSSTLMGCAEHINDHASSSAAADAGVSGMVPGVSPKVTGLPGMGGPPPGLG